MLSRRDPIQRIINAAIISPLIFAVKKIMLDATIKRRIILPMFEWSVSAAYTTTNQPI